MMATSPMQQRGNILVPVTHSQASLDAVATACWAARAHRSKVLALHVIEVLRSLPLNSPVEEQARRGERILRQAENVADTAEYQIRGDLVQARAAGQAIVEEARERSIDTIVMGVEYKGLTGEFQVGRTANYVLRNAHCEVWIVRQALTQDTGPLASRR